MNLNKFDQDGDGDFDLADWFRIALPAVSYTLGIVGMFLTGTRSWHLLSSPMFNPVSDIPLWGWVWPIVTASSAEFGLLLAWIALEVAIRKGRLTRSDWSLAVMICIGAVGFVFFALIVGAMQLYDVDLIQGKDLSQVGEWGHIIASVLPLFTIMYSMIVSSAYASIQRRERESRGLGVTSTIGTSWQVERSVQEPQPSPILQRPMEKPKVTGRDDYGDPIVDPLSSPVQRSPRSNSTHTQAIQAARVNANAVKSKNNGVGRYSPESRYSQESDDADDPFLQRID